VPVGFAHGFAAIEASMLFYKCTNLYNKQAESGLLWNDATINIDWGVTNPIVSDKDQELPTLEKLDYYF
ncbi:MAG TPA: dTDP-4-dehydrorhamnose 3,5-epimerase family protein, partial [Cytophagaceae bacterium]